jgi:uncharacterized damage-inducible protein DinB
MSHDIQDTIALLSRTPVALNAFLRDLPETWTHRNEGENTWNVYDILGHLIHSELTNWIPRMQTILQYGETQPFPPFDREPQQQGKSLAQLLDEFAEIRSPNVETLRVLNLQPTDLDRRGIHPAFGSVTLSQLLATWVAHDLSHLHQIARVMAHQYRDTVGPWIAYLGVMKCTGHSA